MPNPTIVNVYPAPNAQDVILGASIVVTFSEPIDVDSFNNATFALTGPNISSVVTPDQLVESNPTPYQGTGYILGTFGFSTKTYLPWAAFTNYAIGAQIVDSNGNVQTATQTGTSAPYAPAWFTPIDDTTVDNNIPVWQASNTYTFGQYIIDSNSMLQKCTVAGLSGSPTHPTWNQSLHGTTFDNFVTWTNYGPLSPITWINGGVANSGGTTVTFTPSKPLFPGTVYTVLVVGADSVLSNVFVHDLSGNKLLSSYQWSFTTGTLDLNVPPIQNPIPLLKVPINPDQIQIIPRAPVGNDISVIDLIFPAPIDTNSFDPSNLLIGIEPILNDPDVMVPSGASASYVIQGNRLIVTITGA